VGGNAQIKAMRQVAGTLRLDLAQYRSLAAFAQFGSELDKATQAQLARGERLTEVLKQDQFVPLPVERQVLVIYAGTHGHLDGVSTADCRRYERELFAFVETNYPGVLKKIAEQKKLDDTLEGEVGQALEAFAERFAAGAAK
jgi:F-type H+-transporting ATPase subunit alpha